jgi:hypothetical protein
MGEARLMGYAPLHPSYGFCGVDGGGYQARREWKFFASFFQKRSACFLLFVVAGVLGAEGCF